MLFAKKITIHLGYSTEKGRIREVNEDSLSWWDPIEDAEALMRRGRLYIVADGMGGYAAGEIASQTAVEVILREYARVSSGEVSEILRQSILVANEEIYTKAQEISQARMGTTVAMAVVRGSELYTAHVGDSRVYLLRNRHLQLLTRDHTLVNDMVKSGIITPEEAVDHPRQHVLSQALGKKDGVEPEVKGPLHLEIGDRVMLCTDGVSGYLDDRQIEYTLQTTTDDPGAAAIALTQYADAAGGEDNATVMVISVDKAT
jgi:serine/threonine protein phosphatase PrpC